MATASEWRWYCDGCGLPVELPGGGRWNCPGCWHSIRVRYLPGLEPEVRGATALRRDLGARTLDAPCPVHPDRAAVGVCERCGDLRCDGCTRVVQGRFYCPGCTERVRRERSRSLSFRAWLFLGIGGTLIGLSLLISLLALVMLASR